MNFDFFIKGSAETFHIDNNLSVIQQEIYTTLWRFLIINVEYKCTFNLPVLFYVVYIPSIDSSLIYHNNELTLFYEIFTIFVRFNERDKTKSIILFPSPGASG